MALSRESKFMIGIIAAVVVSAAAYLAKLVFAPLALAVFIIAVVWPIQSRLQARVPKVLALLFCMVLTIAVGVAFLSLAVWSAGRVARSLIADSSRYQALYDSLILQLQAWGISVEALWAEHLNVPRVLQVFHRVSGRVNTTLSFWVVALLYVLLGLLEVDDLRANIRAMGSGFFTDLLLEASAATAAKFRKYLLVRTEMSAVTGLLVGCFAWIVGLQFAVEWGVIAFVLNYIPFIGPLIATILPTFLALAQFESWQAVVGIFVCLNLIQFVVGSYIEPRITGSVLSISPLLVLFSVLFWTFIWGMFGAFIAVPIIITILTFCEKNPSSRWVVDLFAGPNKSAMEPQD